MGQRQLVPYAHLAMAPRGIQPRDYVKEQP